MITQAYSRIHEALEAQSEARADTLVLRSLLTGDCDGPTATVNFSELLQRAKGIAAELLQSSAPGDRALLLYDDGIELCAALIACSFAGVIGVPCLPPDPRRLHGTLPRVLAVIDDCKPSHVLTTHVVAEAGKALQSRYPLLGALRWISTDRPMDSRLASFEGRGRAQDIVYLQYTSGSTGTPKGVAVTHQSLAAAAAAIAKRWRYGERHVHQVSWLPVVHDMGLIWGVLLPVFTGASATLMSPNAFLQRPGRWLEAITRFRGVTTAAPNFGYELCLHRIDDQSLATLDLSTLTDAANAAEPIRPTTVRRFIERFSRVGFDPRAMSPCYGLAEATLPVTMSAFDRGTTTVLSLRPSALENHRVEPVAENTADATTAIGCGPVVEGAAVAIVDPNSRRRLPPNEVGEIWVSGPVVAAGYWQRTEESNETFHAIISGEEETAPWLRTGDLGFMRDGELFITSRIKDLIIIRGRNLYPHDVERVAEAAHPAVRRGCSAAFASVDGVEETLGVAVEIDPERLGADSPEGVIDAVRKAISVEIEVVPQLVALIPPRSLFKTTSGKVQRSKTRDAIRSGELECIALWKRQTEPSERKDAPAALPSSHLEQFVWDALERNHGVRASRSVGVQTPFRELGLDSVAAMALSDTIAAHLGRPLSPTILFDYPTVATLCAHLTRGSIAPKMRRRKQDEPVAVIGAACRFPGGITTLEEFWEFVSTGRDAVGEIPDSRWEQAKYYDANGKSGHSQSRWAGLLDDVAQFDAEFFSFSDEEATYTDPQQRLLLEVAWEALERAGISPGSLVDSSTGVFVGSTGLDWLERTLPSDDPTRVNVWSVTGTTPAMAAGRIAHRLGLRGQAVTIDTACSSSLVALHLATQSLRQGECQMALAGGVNLILSPAPMIGLSQAGALSPTGRCRSFASGADGYVRAEGCGLVVLKMLSDAERDGDPVLAVIRGSAVNHDGRTYGLTVPSGRAQRDVIRSALRAASLQPSEIDAVECHGTGTPIGDVIEAEALGAYNEGRSPDAPLWIGSVKSNLGHTEAAAGIAGVIKSVLAVMHRSWPRTLNATQPNEKIDWGRLGLRVANERVEWSPGRPRRIGVSSFGLSGTNAHLIVEEAPARRTPERDGRDGTARYPIVLSARTGPALESLRGRLLTYVRDNPTLRLEQLANTLATGRVHFSHRAAFVAADIESLKAGLQTEALARPRETLPKICFVVSDSVDAAHGDALYRSNDVFRASVDAVWRAAGRARPDERSSRKDPIHDLANAWGFAALLRQCGVSPDIVVAHQGGAVLGALLSGALSLEAACRSYVDDVRDAVIGGRAPSTPFYWSGRRAAVDESAVQSKDFWDTVPRADALAALLSDLERDSQTELLIVPIGAPPPDVQLERGTWLPTDLISCLVALYNQGFTLDWAPCFAADEQKLPTLPTYPFQRQRYWLDLPRRAPTVEDSSPGSEIRRCLDASDTEALLELLKKQTGTIPDNARAILSSLCQAYHAPAATVTTARAEPMPRAALENAVRRTLAKQVRVDEERLTAKTELEALGVDSFNALTLGAKLRETLNIPLPRDFCVGIPTVGELVSALANFERSAQASSLGTGAPDWFVSEQPRAEARSRIFCFPYSGATPAVYRNWHNAFPDVEVRALALPGRANRAAEQPIYSLFSLVGRLADELEPFADKPFAFFGHSFGGYVAFELCRELRRRKRALPNRLFVSACRAPHLPPGDWVLNAVPSLQGEAFWKELLRLEIVPKQIFDEPQLRELVEPAMRADLHLLESWRFTPEAPLDIPITAFGGTADTLVEARHLVGAGLLNLGWRMHSTHPLTSQMIEGDHFFINTNIQALCAAVARQL